MPRDPNKPVDSEHDIDLAPSTRRMHHERLPLTPHDARPTPTRPTTYNGDEEAIAQFPVPQTARVQQRRAIALSHALHLGEHQLALVEELPHLQLIRRRAPPQHPAGQVDRTQRQLGEERGRDVDFPPPRLHFADPPDHQVADGGRVAGAQGRDREELVGAEERADERGVDRGRGRGGVGAVAAHPG